MKYLLRLLKPVIFLIILMPAGVVMAQGPDGSFQTVYAARSGSMTATSTLNLAAGDLNATGDFSFDVIYHDNVDTVLVMTMELHFDSTILEFVGATNEDTSSDMNSTEDHFVPKGETDSSITILSPDNNPDTDRQIHPAWGNLGRPLFTASPARLFTATFRFKPSATGTTKVEFTARDIDFNVAAFAPTTLTIKAPPANNAPMVQGNIVPLSR